MDVFLTILTALLTLVLVIVSGFMVIVILMQRASSNAGLGSALGGGAAESAFGGATTNVLIKATVTAAIVFFVLAYVLHLLYLGTATSEVEAKDLPTGITGVVDPGASMTDATPEDTVTIPAIGDVTPDAAFEGVLESLQTEVEQAGESVGLEPAADAPAEEPVTLTPEVTPDS